MTSSRRQRRFAILLGNQTIVVHAAQMVLIFLMARIEANTCATEPSIV
jgi:hypothetical protein